MIILQALRPGSISRYRLVEVILHNQRVLETMGWQTLVSPTTFVLSQHVISQCLELVNAANAAFVREDTAAWRLLGTPSACGRLDFTIVGDHNQQLRIDDYGDHFPLLDGYVKPYEWEERPGGKGIAALINPQFASLFSSIRQHWPEIHVIIEDGRRGYDDYVWAGAQNVSVGFHPFPDDMYLLIRAEPDQQQYHDLNERSISTLKTKGDKSYGERIGWWRVVTSISDLPRPGTDIIVLKPRQGSKTKDLLITPSSARTRQQGMCTRSKFERLFEEQVAKHGLMYLQPWHPPVQLGDNNLILRIFFARSFDSPRWHCLGGVWNARRSAVVHGAGDTVFGPAIVG